MPSADVIRACACHKHRYTHSGFEGSAFLARSGVAGALPSRLPRYSARNAIIGSMRLALRAGIQQASNAMPNKSEAIQVKVIGSEVLTP